MDGNETLSLLQLTPTIGDNRARLLCRAVNDEIEESHCENDNISSAFRPGAEENSEFLDEKTMAQMILQNRDKMKSDDTTGPEKGARSSAFKQLESYVLLDVQCKYSRSMCGRERKIFVNFAICSLLCEQWKSDFLDGRFSMF